MLPLPSWGIASHYGRLISSSTARAFKQLIWSQVQMQLCRDLLGRQARCYVFGIYGNADDSPNCDCACTAWPTLLCCRRRRRAERRRRIDGQPSRAATFLSVTRASENSIRLLCAQSCFPRDDTFLCAHDDGISAKQSTYHHGWANKAAAECGALHYVATANLISQDANVAGTRAHRSG